jgi:hypothetical protein
VCFEAWAMGCTLGFHCLLFLSSCAQGEFSFSMSQYKVKLFCLEDENSNAELIGRVACQPHESYTDFRGRLELAKCVDWPFQFWDFEDRSRINTRTEAVDTVRDSVNVIRIQEGDNLDPAKRSHVEAIGTSSKDLGFSESKNMVEFHDDDPLELGEPLASSRVSGDDSESYSQHKFEVHTTFQ